MTVLTPMMDHVTIIGGGLAGCEAAWQLASSGVEIRLVDMKPALKSQAHQSDNLAELVCSNSLRSSNPMNAVGLLKQEMARLNSLVMRAADESRVPAGDALAVDRTAFSQAITAALDSHPRIRRHSALISALPPPEAGPVIIATGPLTADGLAAAIVAATGQERLYFYDAMAPIVAGDSIDRDHVYAASRYGKGGGADYLNCPLNQEEYERFVDDLLRAEYMPLHSFEEPKYFQGCLPIEVMAASGPDTLRFGTMKPVGLVDPHTNKRPYAVIQLRQEDRHGQSYNLVGFQTKLKHPEQQRIFRKIPGLGRAEFLRLGGIHRNTFLDSPRLLDEYMRLKTIPHVRFAGQVTGVEGYVESAAHGLMTGWLLARELNGHPAPPPPPEPALGALWTHVLGRALLPGRPYEPQNVHWGLFPLPPAGTRKKDTKTVRYNRAVEAFDQWVEKGLCVDSKWP